MLDFGFGFDRDYGLHYDRRILSRVQEWSSGHLNKNGSYHHKG
jgi:hypothetical protein